MVVYGDGDGASGSGEIAADHKNDAELAERVGESENQRSEDAGKGKRKHDSPECAPRVRAEDARRGEEFWIEALKGGDQRLNAERKAIENAGDDEAGESESERMAEEREPEFAERASRAHGNEEIKTEDGRRQNERKSDDGLDEEFGAKGTQTESRFSGWWHRHSGFCPDEAQIGQPA